MQVRRIGRLGKICTCLPVRRKYGLRIASIGARQGFGNIKEFCMDIIALLITYQFPAIFLGSVIFGETIILAAAYLAGEGWWSVYTVFWITFSGTILSDSVWFYLGGKLIKKSNEWQEKQERYKKLMAFLERVTHGRAFLSLLFIKFMYGTRIITIMYLSIHKLRFRTFLLFNAIGTFFWLLVMVALGWYASIKIGGDIPDIKKFQYGVSALFVFIVLTRVGGVYLRKKIESKE